MRLVHAGPTFPPPPSPSTLILTFAKAMVLSRIITPSLSIEHISNTTPPSTFHEPGVLPAAFFVRAARFLAVYYYVV